VVSFRGQRLSRPSDLLAIIKPEGQA